MDWLWMDTGVPPLDAGESTGQQLQQLQTYVYMLAQQMRYTLQNLGLDNFNSTELEAFNATRAAATHAHTFDDILDSTLQVHRGGTGAAVAADARKNLGITSGTWTPTVTGVTTYDKRSGQYTRIGNLVIAAFDIRCDPISNSYAEIQISGLPCNVDGEAGGGGVCSAGSLKEGLGFAGYFAAGSASAPRTFGPRQVGTDGTLRMVLFGSGVKIIMAGNLIYTTKDD